MLNDLNLLAQNIQRLIDINLRYQHDLHELQQRFAQACTMLEQARSERDTLREEFEALRHERNLLVAKIDDTQMCLNVVLEGLQDTKEVAQQPKLLP